MWQEPNAKTFMQFQIKRQKLVVTGLWFNHSVNSYNVSCIWRINMMNTHCWIKLLSQWGCFRLIFVPAQVSVINGRIIYVNGYGHVSIICLTSMPNSNLWVLGPMQYQSNIYKLTKTKLTLQFSIKLCQKSYVVIWLWCSI